jgi:teichuronic acid biosynthesis glycosyltransferase TuaC
MEDGRIEDLRILLVTNNYPSQALPNVGTFVAALVRAWSAAGTQVAVLSPMPYWSATTGAVVLRDEGAAPDEQVVLRPPFLSFSNFTLRPGWSTARLSQWSFDRAVDQHSEKVAFAPSVVYAHFLFPAAHAALRVGARLGVPVVGALGEADFGEWELMVGKAKAAETARSLDGILAVSRSNADYCISQYGVDPDRVVVVPNAIDPERFHPIDRATARARLGLPADKPIVAFLGNFIERKGPLRVLEAISALPEVGAIFLGAGPQAPSGEQVLFADRVPNEDVAAWLSAANVLVMPTTAEGSPNSILEAMACGLPIVSGDIPALRETASPDAALLVDPMDVEAIREATRTVLADEALAARMSAAALAIASRQTLATRAARIRDWIREVIERYDTEHG